MPRAMQWASVVHLLLPFFCAGTLLPNIDIYRWTWGRAIRVGSFLYLDGGEVIDSSNDSYVPTFTTAIDLRQDWNISNVTGTYIPKPTSYTLTRKALIFSNTDEDTIYTWGGWPFWSKNTFGGNGTLGPGYLTPDGNKTSGQSYPPNLDYVASEQALWSLRLDGNGNGTWSEGAKSSASSSGLRATLGSTVVGSKDTFYTFGGQNIRSQAPRTSSTTMTGFFSTNKNDPSTWPYSANTGWDVASPENRTFVVYGEGVYTDLWGTAGSIVMFGGYSPPSIQVQQIQSSEGSTLWDLSSIAIYDIASDKWMTQKASGQIPQSRWGFCAVAISDAKNQTVDIFIHGGAVTTPKATGIEPDLSYIYVLTLPSFVWTRVENSNNADPDGRSNLNCAIIGNSQMAVIGGASLALQPSPRDPFPNAIGIFDMNSLSWTDMYRASAGLYTRHSILTNVTDSVQYPLTWSSPDTEALFTGSSSGANTNGDGGSNTGAIAGGVVGGVVGAALIAAAAWYFYRRSGRQQEKPELLSSQDDPEKPAPRRRPAANPAELETRTQNLELSGNDSRMELPVVQIPLEMGTDLSMEGKVREYMPRRPIVHELES